MLTIHSWPIFISSLQIFPSFIKLKRLLNLKPQLSKPNFITGDATEYSKHLFRVLDTDKDNMVSWREVMVGFHQLSPSGDPDQKLKLVYSVSTIEQ